jgi:hypothetical protein
LQPEQPGQDGDTYCKRNNNKIIEADNKDIAPNMKEIKEDINKHSKQNNYFFWGFKDIHHCHHNALPELAFLSLTKT